MHAFTPFALILEAVLVAHWFSMFVERLVDLPWRLTSRQDLLFQNLQFSALEDCVLVNPSLGQTEDSGWARNCQDFDTCSP